MDFCKLVSDKTLQVQAVPFDITTFALPLAPIQSAAPTTTAIALVTAHSTKFVGGDHQWKDPVTCRLSQ